LVGLEPLADEDRFDEPRLEDDWLADDGLEEGLDGGDDLDFVPGGFVEGRRFCMQARGQREVGAEPTIIPPPPNITKECIRIY
jgi:hypothetical protein